MSDLGDTTKWSETDSLNTFARPDGFATGENPANIKFIERSWKGAVKRFYDHINSSVIRTGDPNRYVISYRVNPTQIFPGDIYRFFPHQSNTGPVMLQIGSLSALPIVHLDGTPLVANDIVGNGAVMAVFDSTHFHLLTPNRPGLSRTGGTISGNLIVSGTLNSGAFTASSKITTQDGIVLGGVQAGAPNLAYDGSNMALNVPTGKGFALTLNGVSKFQLNSDGGLQIGTPTGGSQGGGSLNVQGLYVNGVAVLTRNSTITMSRDVTGRGTNSIAATVVSTHLSAPLPLAQGGTANTTGRPSGTAAGDLDGTYPSPTLKTVNSNVGSFTNASVTVNAKGLVTAASSGGAVSGTLVAGTQASSTISRSAKVVTAHGLSGVPEVVQVYLQCLSAEHGYGVGERIPVYPGYNNAGTDWFVVSVDATNTYITTSATGFAVFISLVDRSTNANFSLAAADAGNWKLVAQPYKLT